METINNIGNYQIIKPVGSGGMSTVYMALDEKLKRQVALKMLHPHLCNEPLAVERFRREALSAARLDHPNIVRIYDYLIENNTHCIVMEYVPGLDMESIVKKKGRLDFKSAHYIMYKTAVALKAAHQIGLMHRDIKPSNILLNQDGRVMLSDFGLVKNSLDVSLTVDNAVAGTPAFMSPEQISGKKVTYSSDIYSWAVTYYYLMSGTLPYNAKEFAEIVRAIQSAEIRLDKSITDSMPPRHFELISRCLLEDPEARIKNGKELLKKLSDIPIPEEMDLIRLFDLPDVFPSENKTEELSRTRVFRNVSFSNRKAFIIIAAFLVILSGVITLNFYPGKNDSNNAEIPVKSRPLDSIVKPIQEIIQAKELNRTQKHAFISAQNGKAPSSGTIKQKAILSDSIKPVIVPLKNDSGRLFIACEPWANVIIDNRDYGQTPLSGPISLKTGLHIIKLNNPYSEIIEDTVTLEPETILRKKYKLKLKPAYNKEPVVKQ